jgi:hypothetical protein
MKWIKLFESFTNKDKIKAVSKMFTEFLGLRFMKSLNLNLKNFKIESENLTFYYVRKKLIAFKKLNTAYISNDFKIFIGTDLRVYLYKNYGIKYTPFEMIFENIFKAYFKVAEVKITNTAFIQKIYNENIDKANIQPPVSKLSFTDKLIQWLDSGKETTKDEFMRSIGYLKVKDLFTQEFVIPKNYYHGQLSEYFNTLGTRGLIKFVRRGKDSIIVKGDNFEELKAKRKKNI